MTPQCCTLNREGLIFTFNCINRGFSQNNMESIINLDVAILEGLDTTRLLLHIMMNYCHFFGLQSPADREKRLKNCRKKDCPKYRDVCGGRKSDFIVKNTTVNKFRHTTTFPNRPNFVLVTPPLQLQHVPLGFPVLLTFQIAAKMVVLFVKLFTYEPLCHVRAFE